jgi:hypothetical protein
MAVPEIELSPARVSMKPPDPTSMPTLDALPITVSSPRMPMRDDPDGTIILAMVNSFLNFRTGECLSYRGFSVSG